MFFFFFSASLCDQASSVSRGLCAALYFGFSKASPGNYRSQGFLNDVIWDLMTYFILTELPCASQRWIKTSLFLLILELRGKGLIKWFCGCQCAEQRWPWNNSPCSHHWTSPLTFFSLLLLADEFNMSKELHACQKSSQCRVGESKTEKSFTLRTHRGSRVSDSLRLWGLPSSHSDRSLYLCIEQIAASFSLSSCLL